MTTITAFNMSNEKETVDYPDHQEEGTSDEEENLQEYYEGNLFYAIWGPHFNHHFQIFL